jgi:filamentous hemagglutinin family protein
MPADTGSFTFLGVQASAANANAILANPSGYYFNVHSVLNGSRVIRGQLR